MSEPLVFTIQVGKDKKDTPPLDPASTTLGVLKEVIFGLTHIPAEGQKISSRRCTTLMKKKNDELLSDIFKGKTSSTPLTIKNGDVFLVTGTPLDERDLGTRSDFDPHRPMLAGTGNFQMQQHLDLVDRLGAWVWVQSAKSVFRIKKNLNSNHAAPSLPILGGRPGIDFLPAQHRPESDDGNNEDEDEEGSEDGGGRRDGGGHPPGPFHRANAPGVAGEEGSQLEGEGVGPIPSMLPLEGFLLCLYMEVMSQRSPESSTTEEERKVKSLICAQKRREVLAEIQRKQKLNVKAVVTQGVEIVQERDVAFCCKLARMISLPVQLLRAEGALPIHLAASGQGKNQRHMYCHTFGPTPHSAKVKPFHPHWYTCPISWASCHKEHSSSPNIPLDSHQILDAACHFENIPLLLHIAANEQLGVPRWGQTFKAAVCANSSTVVAALLRWKSSLAWKEANSINYAAAKDSSTVLRKILKSPEALDCNSDSAPPLLMTCAVNDSYQCADLLARELHVAVNRPHKRRTLVVSFPTESSIRDGHGHRGRRRGPAPQIHHGIQTKAAQVTPLWECVVSNSVETAQVLISQDAQLFGPQVGPHSLLTLAYFCRSHQVAKLLWSRAQSRSKVQDVLAELHTEIEAVQHLIARTGADHPQLVPFATFDKKHIFEWMTGEVYNEADYRVSGSSSSAESATSSVAVGEYKYQGGASGSRAATAGGGGGQHNSSSAAGAQEEAAREQWMQQFRLQRVQEQMRRELYGGYEDEVNAEDNDDDDQGGDEEEDDEEAPEADRGADQQSDEDELYDE